MQDLADRVGVSYSYMTQVARGRQSMGVKVQARVESTLQAPAKVAPAKCANRQGVVVAGESSYIRERARELGMTACGTWLTAWASPTATCQWWRGVIATWA